MKPTALVAALALLCSPALAAPPPADPAPAATDAQVQYLKRLIAQLQQQRDAAASKLQDQLALDATYVEIAKEAAAAKAKADAPAKP